MAGFWSKIFGGTESSNEAEASSVQPKEKGTESVDALQRRFGLTDDEMDSRLARLGISPVDGFITKEEADALRKDHYSAMFESTGGDDESQYDKYPAEDLPRSAVKPKKEKVQRLPEAVLPSQIVSDYSADAASARNTYRDKWITFSGTAGTVSRDGNNFILDMKPDDANFYGSVVCRFVSTAEAKLSAIRPGQRITIAGFLQYIGLDYRNDMIKLVNTSILEAEPAPASDSDVIVRSEIPAEGSKVYSETGREYVLGPRLGDPGGEGSVYELKDAAGRVAKIYNAKSCTVQAREKVKELIKSRIGFNGILLPQAVLNTREGAFTGFIMERARGRTLSSLFVPKSEFEQIFPNWKKADIVKLGISILKRIKYLHDHDILLGDISPKNIMFVSPDEVYFIDMDSCQFGDYPCRVGTDDCTPPELLGRDLSKVMRTIGNENFAVASLLFMLLMQGKQPYAHQDGSQSTADIKAGIFPYGVGDRPVPGNVREQQPQGLWRYIWSHLTFNIKDAFVDTFRADGNNNTESTRYSADHWLTLMYAYNTALPEMIRFDPMSGEIFPDREKRSKKVTYRRCVECGEEKPDYKFYDETTCRDCHENFRSKVWDIFTCITPGCGKEFTITNGEREHYESKNLPLPRRCPDCRKARKEARR